jgi:nitrate/nitrite transporter NarK
MIGKITFCGGVEGVTGASSMSNISTFFPKRLQGTGLGLNAGLGNFGVTTMQILIPVVMTIGLFGAIGGEPITTTVEGRERYTINVRYARELRDNLPKPKTAGEVSTCTSETLIEYATKLNQRLN